MGLLFLRTDDGGLEEQSVPTCAVHAVQAEEIMMTIDVAAVMALAPVIPVLVIDDVAHARPSTEALVAGGLPALEVTLRTSCALEAIREMAKAESAVVGAGTVLNARKLDAAQEAGAKFIVSPGLTDPLAKAAIEARIAFLPGTASAGDMMRDLDLGLTHFNFFPAVAAGGVPALKAILAPIADVLQTV